VREGGGAASIELREGKESGQSRCEEKGSSGRPFYRLPREGSSGGWLAPMRSTIATVMATQQRGQDSSVRAVSCRYASTTTKGQAEREMCPWAISKYFGDLVSNTSA
jgi:hypothetical protein